MARDDLSEAAVHGVANLDEVIIEEDEESAVKASSVCTADEFHDHTARDVAVLVDVYSALLVCDDEFAIAETEHAERAKALDAVGDAMQGIMGILGFGAEVRDGPGLLLVESENFDATLGGDGEGRVEHVDAIAFSGDVELVIFAEELRLGATRLEEAGFAGCGFLKDGL